MRMATAPEFLALRDAAVRNRRRWSQHLASLGAALLLLIACDSCLAAAPSWADLDPAQQQMLHGLSTTWDQLPEDRRNNLLEGVRRWQALSPEQRQQAEQRWIQWNQLDPDRRARLRALRAEFDKMDEAQRERLRARVKALRALPPSERDEIRQRFRELRSRPGGLDAACGPGSIGDRMNCLGIPHSGSSQEQHDTDPATPATTTPPTQPHGQ